MLIAESWHVSAIASRLPRGGKRRETSEENLSCRENSLSLSLSLNFLFRTWITKPKTHHDSRGLVQTWMLNVIVNPVSLVSKGKVNGIVIAKGRTFAGFTPERQREPTPVTSRRRTFYIRWPTTSIYRHSCLHNPSSRAEYSARSIRDVPQPSCRSFASLTSFRRPCRVDSRATWNTIVGRSRKSEDYLHKREMEGKRNKYE